MTELFIEDEEALVRHTESAKIFVLPGPTMRYFLDERASLATDPMATDPRVVSSFSDPINHPELKSPS